MQRVMFTESPDHDGDDNFKKGYFLGGMEEESNYGSVSNHL